MATYYWVGGDGTWDNANTTNWSASSGGAGGSGPPLAADTCIFDSASGTGTCTTAATAAGRPTMNSATLLLKLGANFTSTSALSLTSGNVDLDGYTFTCFSVFSQNSNTRSIAFGSGGKFILTGNAATIWNTYDATNFTYTGTSRVECNYAGAVGTRTLWHGLTGSTAANGVSFYINAGTDIVRTRLFVSGCKTLDFTGFTGSFAPEAGDNRVQEDLVFGSGMTTISIAITLTCLATPAVQNITTNGVTVNFPMSMSTNPANTVKLIDNLTLASDRTFTLTQGILDLNNQTLSAGLFNSSNSFVRSIAFGTGNITTTGSGTVWTTATLTNFSRTGTPTVNISNNSATAATVSTGAMTAAQALDFNYTTGTYTLTDTTAVYRSVNFTGFAGTIPNSVRTIFGGLTLSTGMTLTAGANATTFASTSAGNTITSAGKTQDYPLIFDGIGGTFAFQDALTQGSTRAFTLTNGTVQLKDGVTSTVGVFATSSTNQKFLQSTLAGSQATLSQASGTVNVQNVNAQDIDATGGARWNLVNGSVNYGNLSGWYVAHQQNAYYPSGVF